MILGGSLLVLAALALGRSLKVLRTCPKYVCSMPGNRLSTRSGRGVAAPGGVELPEPIWSLPVSSSFVRL